MTRINGVLTSQVTRLFQDKSYSPTLNSYIGDLNTTLITMAFDTPEWIHFAAHDALNNEWLFSAREPNTHSRGRWRVRGMQRRVPSNLPEQNAARCLQSPVFMRKDPTAPWTILHPIRRRMSRSPTGQHRRLHTPYVQARLADLGIIPRGTSCATSP